MLLYSNQQVPLEYITIMSSVRAFPPCFGSDTQLLLAGGIKDSLSVKGTFGINYFHFSCAGVGLSHCLLRSGPDGSETQTIKGEIPTSHLFQLLPRQS